MLMHSATPQPATGVSRLALADVWLAGGLLIHTRLLAIVCIYVIYYLMLEANTMIYIYIDKLYKSNSLLYLRVLFNQNKAKSRITRIARRIVAT